VKAIREENGTREAQADASGGKDAKPKQRAVSVISDDPEHSAGGIVWSRDGKALAIQVFSLDNKDRWIASVDFDKYVLVPQHRLSDPAWINWTFNEVAGSGTTALFGTSPRKPVTRICIRKRRTLMHEH